MSEKLYKNVIFLILMLMKRSKYRKVASSGPVYYSILDHFVQRLQYISIKIPLPSLKILEFATNRDSLLLATLQYV